MTTTTMEGNEMEKDELIRTITVLELKISQGEFELNRAKTQADKIMWSDAILNQRAYLTKLQTQLKSLTP